MSTPTSTTNGPSGALTAEQVLALAPDASAAERSAELAAAGRWSGLSLDTRACWGIVRFSGPEPYRAMVDLAGPALRCTCPSRKQPCKHAVGLLLLLVKHPDAFGVSTERPDWVEAFVVARDRSAAREEKAAASDRAVDVEAQAQRVEAREEKVTDGLRAIEGWLSDLLRRGLTTAQADPAQFERAAERLVDAQARGIARMVGELRGIVTLGETWPERTLARLARVHLAAVGWRHRERLTPEERDDLRQAIGWTWKKEELRALPGVRDRWRVVGRRVEEDAETGLRTQRLWMRGHASGDALLLDFAFGREPFDHGFAVGGEIDAELSFFPSAAPLRAVVKTVHSTAVLLGAIDAAPSLSEALGRWAEALARCPWIEQFPLALGGVVPIRRNARWILRDAAGRTVPLQPRFEAPWQLLALSGGRPLDVFGEFDGERLLPLGALPAEGGYVGF